MNSKFMFDGCCNGCTLREIQLHLHSCTHAYVLVENSTNTVYSTIVVTYTWCFMDRKCPYYSCQCYAIRCTVFPSAATVRHRPKPPKVWQPYFDVFPFPKVFWTVAHRPSHRPTLHSECFFRTAAKKGWPTVQKNHRPARIRDGLNYYTTAE